MTDFSSFQQYAEEDSSFEEAAEDVLLYGGLHGAGRWRRIKQQAHAIIKLPW